MNIINQISDSLTDTICAISTPTGVGGIAVARVSGKNAIEIADKIWKGNKRLSNLKPNSVTFGTVFDCDGEPLDEALATVFYAPASFTGENTVEISVHGSKYIQRELIDSLVKAGARIAHQGEFTRKAFVNGKMDLTEAEAVADMIASTSKANHHIAMRQMRGGISEKLSELRLKLLNLASLIELELDFSEEDVEFASRENLFATTSEVLTEINRLLHSFSAGSAIKDGIPVAIVGPTNAGKSSILNLILNDNKAIVSDIHGTTRDVVEDTAEIGNYIFRFMDTAGLRDTSDPIEQMGIERTIQSIKKSQIILVVGDSSLPLNTETLQKVYSILNESTTADAKVFYIQNKADLVSKQELMHQATELAKQFPDLPIVSISTKHPENVDVIADILTNCAKNEEIAAGDILITNLRHAQTLSAAANSCQQLLNAINSSFSIDIVAEEIRQTINILGEITGSITSEDILQNIFSKFCVGK